MNSFFSKWGYQVSQEVANPNIPFTASAGLPVSKKIFKGPFGNVTGFQQGGGTQGYFSKMPPDAVVLGVNAGNKPVLVFDCTTKDILCADTDVLTSLGTISAGALIKNDNDRLFGNLIHLACEMRENSANLPACSGSAGRIGINTVNPEKMSGSEGEEKETEVDISPNPAENNFSINLNHFKNQRLKISVYNQSQNLLLEKIVSETDDQKRVEIDTGKFSEGVVYVVITDQEGKKVTKKIIIKH